MLRILKKIKYPLTIIICLLLIITVLYLNYRLQDQKYDDISLVDVDSIIMDDNIQKDIVYDICTVDIKGAIKNPGVYYLPCDKLVNDVISEAGGLLNNSDTSIINLAKKINNEMVIIIYTKEEVKNSNIVNTVVKTIEKECVCPNIQNDGCINTEITDNIDDNTNNLVNINTASVEQLLTLPGIGEAKAKAIIKYREQNLKFDKIEDIQNVDGIGSKLYEDIKAYITT